MRMQQVLTIMSRKPFQMLADRFWMDWKSSYDFGNQVIHLASIAIVVPLTTPVDIRNGPKSTIRIESLRIIMHSDHGKAVDERQIHPTPISMVSTSYEEHLQVGLALSWLCATFGSCPASFLHSSEVRFNERETADSSTSFSLQCHKTESSAASF